MKCKTLQKISRLCGDHFLIKGKPICLKKPTFPLAQSSAPALPISSRDPLDKARSSLRSALWAGGLAEPPLSKMAALWMRKYRYHLSDERVVAMWQESSYDQYLAGEATFQWGPPCAASD
jgi:hypothetical protein